MNGNDCELGDAYVDEKCNDGVCEGISVLCLTMECATCSNCEEGTCVPDQALAGLSCEDKYGSEDAVCVDGGCVGSGPALTMVDSLTIGVGLQENDLDNLKANVVLEGISAINWPWAFVESDKFIVVSGADFPVDPDSCKFEIIEDCDFDPDDEDELCVQDWRTSFTVDKVCDVVSTYEAKMVAESGIAEGMFGFLWYEVALAQAAVCGAVIEDVPIDGKIEITDSTFQAPAFKSQYGVEESVYFKATLDGATPIETSTTVRLSIAVGGKDHLMIGYEPSINQNMKDLIKFDLSSEKNEIYWSFFLHEDWFAGEPGVASGVVISLTAEVEYGQSRRTIRRQLISTGMWSSKDNRAEFRIDEFDASTFKSIAVPNIFDARRMLQEEAPGYEFNSEFWLMPLQCIGTYSDVAISPGQYADVPCEDGDGSMFIFCSESGWDLDQSISEFCADEIPAAEVVEAEETKSGPNIMLLAIVGAVAVLLVLALAKACFCKKPDKLGSGGRGRSKGSKRKDAHMNLYE